MRIKVPAVMKRVIASFTSFVLVVSMVSGAMPFFVSEIASASSPYVQGFESDTSDWTNVAQAPSGMNGIPAATGSSYATANSDSFTRWGGYRSSFPSGGYSTQLDVYLDMARATGANDERFDFSSAINNQAGTHLRDFIFNLGTNPTVANQWLVNVSNGAPGNPSAPGNAVISTTGWYTLKQEFRSNLSGVLEVRMSITQKNGGQVNSWTLSNPTDVIATTVGGNRYGWFVPVGFSVPSVAIDNAQLVLGITTQPTVYDFDTVINGSGNFTQYQPNEFTVTTHTDDPNGDNSPMVRAYFTDGGAGGVYEYYDGTTFQPFDGTTGFGPAGGFEYQDGVTSTFRARYAKTGTFTSHIQFRQVGSNAIIAEKDVVFNVVPSAPASIYSNGFETDTSSWANTDGVTTVDRVPNGTNGVTSATGDYHALASESDYTNWGGYTSQFPSGGYVTEQDVYLDMAQADGSDKRIDFSSAINDPSGAHRRDFVVTLGTKPGVANQWVVNAGNNTPGNPSAPGSATITTTGWYTIQHSFRDNGSGVLEVTMKLIKISDGSTVGTWVTSNPSDVIGSTVGGNRYGWFVTNDFASLPIDNTRKGPNPSPTAPRPIVVTPQPQPSVPGRGAGLISVVTLSTFSPLASSTSASDLASSTVGALGVTATTNSDKDILGAQTKKQTAKTPVVEATDSGWKIFGIAWYWWILILLALGLLAWLIAAYRRRREEEEN